MRANAWLDIIGEMTQELQDGDVHPMGVGDGNIFFPVVDSVGLNRRAEPVLFLASLPAPTHVGIPYHETARNLSALSHTVSKQLNRVYYWATTSFPTSDIDCVLVQCKIPDMMAT